MHYNVPNEWMNESNRIESNRFIVHVVEQSRWMQARTGRVWNASKTAFAIRPGGRSDRSIDRLVGPFLHSACVCSVEWLVGRVE